MGNSVILSLLLTTAVGMLLIACGQPAPPAAEETPAQPDAETEAAPAVDTFDAAAWAATTWTDSCAKCHGATAMGDGPMLQTVPELQGEVPVFNKAFFDKETDEDLVNAIRDGRPRNADKKKMPPFGGEFTDEEIGHIVAWLRAEFGAR
jgi:mono/diheme cytochrome c family protein